MHVRPAECDDRSDVEAIAARSLQSSYSLSPADIETLVEHAFSPSPLADRLGDADRSVLVAEDGDEVVGFADVDADNTLHWLHVAPTARGDGAGTSLVEAARADGDERGAPFTARLLEDAREGSEFLTRFGLSQTGTAERRLGGERFPERVYTPTGSTSEPNESSVEVPTTLRVDGRELAVDREAETSGTLAPFFALTDSGTDERWGYFCTACGSGDVAVDTLDRLACADCGNTHLPDQWDGAYL